MTCQNNKCGNSVHFDDLFCFCMLFLRLYSGKKMLPLIEKKGNAYNTKKICFQQLEYI